MVNENNIYLIENKKPFELVQEIDNKVLSFEEFMESYENDEAVNYDDLTHSDIGSSKGYGPCHTCGNKNLQFELKIILENWDGAGRHALANKVINKKVINKVDKHKNGSSVNAIVSYQDDCSIM